MSEFLFEIGVEEIPSSYIKPAVTALSALLSGKLNELSLPHENIAVYATPRRLAIAIDGLPDTRPAKKVKSFGPPAKAAFAPDGKPTKAAIGFAVGKGVDVSLLKTEATDKGEYVYVELQEGGERTVDLLAKTLPELIFKIPFPKSMRWGEGTDLFTRPIHWIVALFDGVVVPFEVAFVKSGSLTRGHRFMGSQAIEVACHADYVAKLKDNFVIVDADQRETIIREDAKALAVKHGAELVEDNELVEAIAYLTEWPVAMWGSFEEEYLALPDELLITSLKAHQRMFTVKGADGKLLNGFIGVSNMIVKDEKVVVSGYQRVLKARLSDAKFFFDEDHKHTLEIFGEKLNGVIYQKKLGTVGEKVERIIKLAGYLADEIIPDKKDAVTRAAKLCKADLESLMVYEFPELQGVMGREYALYAGEPSEVATAIYESYLPKFAGDALPATDIGAIVSMADRIDSIVGCFGIGQVPSGTQDPFALRRQALGIIHIIADKGYTISLGGLIKKSLSLFSGKIDDGAGNVETKVVEFFGGRLKHLWILSEIPYDVADAVLAVGFDDMSNAHMRAVAMAELKKKDFFTPLAITFKRVANITRGHMVANVMENLFEEEIEKKFYEQACGAEQETARMFEKKEFLIALERVAALRPVVDTFFEKVLVMAEDPKLKNNRLNLLSKVSSLFLKVADFSKIVA